MTSQHPFRSVRVTSLAWALGASFTLATGCGGESTPAAESPRSAASKAAADENASGDSASSEEESESASPSACADGTCFACGAGSCLQGWYCDENASGGAACSWLPDCSKAPDCACIGKVLGSACSCEESGGGPHVQCK